jgi:hypothetical protein
MLAAVETVTKADAVWEPRRHDSDVAAQATAGESVHGLRLLEDQAASMFAANASNVHVEARPLGGPPPEELRPLGLRRLR